jgi:lipopolysaccharide export LptBFGC system permease protein LptF
LLVALTVGAATIATPAGTAQAAATASQAKAKRQALHQFTGVVTALDKTSITVEKSGKKPKTMVFTRHAEMNTQGGEIEREAKVTVYYRDEDGKPVARKVVVKEAEADGS